MIREQVNFVDEDGVAHHWCAPGRDPVHHPQCPHPSHDEKPELRAMREHIWVGYVAKREGSLSHMASMCDRCGQDFSRVYFQDNKGCPGMSG